jgi:hypothetical protein
VASHNINQFDYDQKKKEIDLIEKEIAWIDKLIETKTKQANNNAKEFDRTEELRQREAALQSEIRISKVVGDTRRLGLTDFKLTLDAELDLIKDQTTEKLRLIKSAMVKEKEGKSDAEKSMIEKRTGEEMAATRALEVAGKASAQRRFEISEEQRKVDLATQFHSIQIDSLERQGELGDNLAKIEAERLKITDETAQKRLKFQEILRDGKSSLGDRLKAGAALSFLNDEEGRRKALAGTSGVYNGALASASTSYFSGGVKENTLETIIVSPLLEQQRAANELLKQTLDKIDQITSSLTPFLKQFGASTP